ncbi:MAG: PAS domain S-box protein [Deltaproteobacteria bacterium]|nr:PAS domain S-box protein [Deltaproteobacteria bacterium]
MQGENKTLEKLITIEKTINDLVEMRHQIIELKASEAQRQMALVALQSSESKYKTLAENIPQKLFIKDKNSVYVSCNQNYAQDLKIEADQIVGKTDYDFFPRELAEKYIADDKRIMEKGKPEDIECRYIQNGQERIVHMVKTPVRDEKGNISGVLGIFWDITEQKQKEEELRKDRAHLAEQISEYKAELQRIQERQQQESNERRRVEEELRRLEGEFKETRANLEKQIFEGTAALQSVNGQFQKEISERKRIEEEFRKAEEEFKKSRAHMEEQLSERTAGLRTVNEQLQRVISERQRLEEEFREAGEKLRALEGQVKVRTAEWQAVKEQLQQEGAERQRLEAERGMAVEKLRTLEARINERTAELQTVNERLQREIDIHKKLEEELRRREEEANRLVRENTIATEIGNIAGSAMNLKEVYERFAEFASEVGKIIPFDRIATTILNPEDNTLNITYVTGLDMANRRTGDVLPLSGTSAEEVMRTRASLLIQKENQGEAIGRFPDLLTYFEAGFQSLLFVPLIAKDQVIGILNFLSTKPDAYTQVDLRLAEKVGNQIAGAISNAQHFLERKREAETLRASEQKYRSGLDLAPVGIWVSVKEKITFANPKCAKILGYSPEELLAKTLPELLHSEDLTRVMEKYARWASGETPPTIYVSRFIHKDGRMKWLENKVGLVEWEGKPAIIHFVTDVTERKRSEQTLRSAVEPFRILVQSIEEIVSALEKEQK